MSGFNGSSAGDPRGDPSIASVGPPENAVSEPIPGRGEKENKLRFLSKSV